MQNSERVNKIYSLCINNGLKLKSRDPLPKLEAGHISQVKFRQLCRVVDFVALAFHRDQQSGDLEKSHENFNDSDYLPACVKEHIWFKISSVCPIKASLLPAVKTLGVSILASCDIVNKE